MSTLDGSGFKKVRTTYGSSYVAVAAVNESYPADSSYAVTGGECGVVVAVAAVVATAENVAFPAFAVVAAAVDDANRDIHFATQDQALKTGD